MKRFSAIFAVFLFLVNIQFAQSEAINIIPKPRSVRIKPGKFNLAKNTKIWALGGASGRKNAVILNDFLERLYGFRLKVVTDRVTKDVIVLRYGDTAEVGAYSVYVDSGSVQLVGSEESGMLYAVQTFVQLLPNEHGKQIQVPSAVIEDSPRFKYRGMHLDVARHFMPVSFVKKFIDLMSQYKFNTFHWHLTEDQGWRIEIKKYPKLTEIGSKRPETVKERNLSPYIGDGIPHGGFYTQDEIKDVVAYAKARYITVIPEIELPGHASAALAAYPELGCKTDYQYKVQTTWGIFKEVYCPTEKTFEFLEDVLSETIALFPDSHYVHIGGDEVLKDHWKESQFVQELKARENLKDEHEVQSNFIRRIEKFINSKGKKMIGWDEILEGGLAPNATVMSWRGMKGGIEAAKAKHDVIMTPTDYVYFDYGQGDPAYEPLNIGSYVPLEKVYSFEPVPKELSADEAKYIIGGQGNVWTEYMKTPAHVEYMVFPRMLALSEVLWSRPEDKNYDDFTDRLFAQFPRLDKQGVNYRIPEPAGLQNVIVGQYGKATIKLSPPAGTRVYYTTDGSKPDERSTPYANPIEIELKPGEVATLKIVVVNPNGRKSSVYAATLIRRGILQPVELAERKQGVNYELIVPNNDPSSKEAVYRAETKSLQLNQFVQLHNLDLKKLFRATFDGYFNVPADGVYEFQIDSTWDPTVVLGGQKIIDDIGTKDRKVRSAIVPLKAGLHKISLRYNHRGGDLNFRFRWGIKGQGLRQASGGEFFH